MDVLGAAVRHFREMAFDAVRVPETDRRTVLDKMVLAIPVPSGLNVVARELLVDVFAKELAISAEQISLVDHTVAVAEYMAATEDLADGPSVIIHGGASSTTYTAMTITEGRTSVQYTDTLV